jgi:hypothetical protein
MANEIVAPDVLARSEPTVKRSTVAFKSWSTDLADDFQLLDLRVMIVPQGEDPWAWRTCLQSLVLSYERAFRRVGGRLGQPVIGISKDYEVWDGGVLKLLEDTVIPMDLDIHLLGWGRDLWALGEIAHRWPRIRSTDSAKPFVYALAGIELDVSKPPPTYPKRPVDYFSRTLTPEQLNLAYANVAVFKVMANDTR